MTSCVVQWCRRRREASKKNTGITYHRFPLNEIRRSEWIKAVRLERREDDWLPSNASRVCSIHFEDDDLYTSRTGNRMLAKSAVPICTMVRKTSFQPEEQSSDKLCFLIPLTSKLQKQPVNQLPLKQESVELASEIVTSDEYKIKCEYTDDNIISTDVQTICKNNFQPEEQSPDKLNLLVPVTSKLQKQTIHHLPLEQHSADPVSASEMATSNEYQIKSEYIENNINIISTDVQVKCPKCAYEYTAQIDEVTEDFVPDDKKNFHQRGDNDINMHSCKIPVHVPSSDNDFLIILKTRKLEAELERKSLLAQKRFSTIRNLQRRNKRLELKCTRLKSIINDLKNKISR